MARRTNLLSEQDCVLASGIASDGGKFQATELTQSQPDRDKAAQGNGTQLIRVFLLALGIVCTFGATMFRLIYLWQQCSSGGRISTIWLTIQVSLLLTIEACLLAMAVLLALIVPPLIVTWTTALVFDFMFRHLVNIFGTALSKTESETVRYSTSNDRLRRNGMRIAKEMLGINAAGAGVVTLCFIATFCLRNYLRYL